MTNYAFQSLLDFTRTTSGTFVGSNGLIQNTPASVNLLTYSQEFDNAAWTKTNATITANATTAPDGTLTADKLVENTVNTSHYVVQAAGTVGNTETFSVYAKAAERTWAYMSAGAGVSVYFDLQNGVQGTRTGGISASISAAGNGWYRCSFTVTRATNTNNIVATATSNGGLGYTGDGTSGIFVWGAQLQTGSTATDYTRNNGGVYPARFDYDPATLQPKGILIEEQRVNYLLGVRNFDPTVTTGWSTSGDAAATFTVVTDTAALAAAGLSGICANAQVYRLNNTAGTTNAFVRVTTALTMSTDTWSFSAYVRGTGVCNIDVNAGTWTGAGSFALSANYTRRVSTSTTSVSTNQYRLWATAGSDVYFILMQAEIGAFATSVIPITGASQVTRTADQCTITAPMFAPWYNQTQGTFVATFDTFAAGGSFNIWVSAATDSTPSGRIVIGGNPASGRGFVFASAATQADMLNGTITNNATIKSALAFTTNDFAFSTNGLAPTVDTSGTLPTPDRLSLGQFNGTFINGHIRFIQYYPVRLADFQLQALTA